MLRKRRCRNGVATIELYDVATKNILFEDLEDDQEPLLQELKAKIVNFEELLHLSDSELKTVLARTDTSLWAPALVHSSRKMQRRIFDNLAAQPAKILKREMEQASNIDFILGSAAQASIISSVLELRDSNLIDKTECRRAA